ncbi:3'-5' exonuclease [Suttonella ornithocola]|uniref:Predicted 3'-5' exonuclease related to the exonuclease domain of PolB n=1 Tax=Suttonella ornithocola TaxID=279832 RepID=A0A380MN97_9GAMM|nr:3'-5' exonuclease [Suttonella ornithocola]SUO93772.1 Predicted 3'-5' exonuclease related to the exonuclease domain of PolB [Suttonella ornithocola]
MLDSNILVFDIETVADTEGYRRLHSLPQATSYEELLALMQQERLAATGTTFIRHHLQKIAAISLLWVNPQNIKLWSLGRNGENEQTILARFFEGIDKLTPTLVSWNGSGFDLPVLHYRALFHGISAPSYFEVGDNDREARYNNYLGRFHWKHIDIMDVLSGYQARAVAPLNDIAKLCGLPGKLDIDGGNVQTLWDANEKETICDYCETDVANTYGVFLHFERLRGRLTEPDFQHHYTQFRQYLMQKNQPHLQAFLDCWK